MPHHTGWERVHNCVRNIFSQERKVLIESYVNSGVSDFFLDKLPEEIKTEVTELRSLMTSKGSVKDTVNSMELIEFVEAQDKILHLFITLTEHEVTN